MKKKAILATDLSETADLLLDCTDQYKALGIESITLFHALGISYTNFAGYTFMDNTKKKLNELKEQFEEKGFKTEIVLKEGQPARELVQFAKKDPETLIIIGTKGMGFAKGVLIGSTADQVLRFGENPLLLIQLLDKLEENNDPAKCEFYCHDINRNVLFATDFSEPSEQAFYHFKKQVAPQAEHILLMHVQNWEAMKHRDEKEIQKFNDIDQSRLERLKEDLQKVTEAAIDINITTGVPSQEIIKTMKEHSVSLVVMGAQGRNFISDHILGSTVRRVIEGGKINTLVIPSTK
ncbi:MAG: universal stress protein [Balneolaceae bacterium]|nr:universal stress protein [Balneolaceae bacterium]